MKENISYLAHLRFNPALKKSWIARYLTNPRLLWLLLMLILIIGVTSFFNLPRRLNPEIKIPLVIVSTVLPGAGPDDIEQLVTVPIERAVRSLPDIQTVTSISRDSVSLTQIEFNANVNPDKARSDVQSAIDSVNLPADAQDPHVQKLDFENQPVVIMTITGKNDTASLIRFSENLKEKIKDITSVGNVTVSGIEEQEIQLVLRPEAIATYKLNPLQLSQLVASAVKSYPAGSVETDTSSFALTIDPAVRSIDDLRHLYVSINGSPVPLSEVAIIQERSKPGQRTTYYANKQISSEKSVSISVYKTSSADITEAADAVEKTVKEEIQRYPGQFAAQTVFNSAHEINDQFNELLRDFIITIILVFITLFIFLGARQAIVASISAPLTFLISFAVMSLTGITLNFLSLFSLLLSLGLLVDDTIVVISAMTAYHRTGRLTPVETGLLVWRDFVVAIFTTTITTVWAFMPLLLSTGIIGEFIKSIPIVVSSTLLASFFVAMFVNLPLITFLLKPTMPRRVVIFLRVVSVIVLLALFIVVIPKGPILVFELIALAIFVFLFSLTRTALLKRSKQSLRQYSLTRALTTNLPKYADDGIIHFSRITRRYQAGILRILASQRARKTVIAMVLVFSLFSYLLVPFGFVKNEFFPSSDTDTLYISVALPPGTNNHTAEIEAVRLMKQIRTLHDLDFATATIGQAFDPTSGVSEGESNNILITLSLLPREDRYKDSIGIAQDLRKQFGMYQPGTLSVIEESGGPPAGADLQIELSGEDLSVLQSYADKTIAYLKSIEGTTNVDKSIKPGTAKLVFVPDQEKLTRSNVTQDQLGLWLRLFASGVPADKVTFAKANGEETDITVRLNEAVEKPENISDILLPSPIGPTVPLTDLGKVTLSSNPTRITRTDGERTIAVTASVQPGFTTTDLNQKLEHFADTNLGLPEGYSWKTGGVNEENQKSVNSILQAMLLSFLLIIITMVLQFSSFRKALIVMLVIPLSISGVFIIFALTQTPLSFPALIGVLALFGIVVKNSILIVDKISQNERAGMPFVEGIVDGASSRLEAIALTSIAAIIGLIPITLSDPLWRGLGGAIIAGLTFSGTIMLFFIPLVYYYWFKPTEGRIRNRTPRKNNA